MAYCEDCNDPNCTEQNQPDPRFELQLRYTDKEHDIDLHTKLFSPPTLTIYGITKDLLEFLYLDDISPNEVQLTGFSRNGRDHILDKTDAEMKLNELGVISGCVLYFEPTPNAAPPKLCHLTIVGPDEIKKVDYEWYRAKTTLGMLLEYVIEHFSLESVQLERIHLMTIFEELAFAYHSDKRLSVFGIHSGMSVHVQIIPPLSPTTVNEDIDVHVEYAYKNHKCLFDIPNTETISRLKIKMEKLFEGYDLTNFKLYDENKEELDLNDSNRTLKSFDVQPDQTIVATFHPIIQNTQPPVVSNEREASTNTKKKSEEKVIVVCNYPANNTETMHVSLKDTIGELIRKIETKTSSQGLVLTEICSNTTQIDMNNDTLRCLADLGFTSDDTIYATMIDETANYSNTTNSRSPSSPNGDKQLKVRRINKKPMGLDRVETYGCMNSVLQCLAHVPQLTDFFLEGLFHAHKDDDDWNPYDQVGEVTGAYADLLWKLWRCDENNEASDSIKPNRIKQKISDKDARFASGDQQDAQEFMSFFLDIIDEELKSKNRNDTNTVIKQLFFGEMTSIITCMSCNKEESTKHPISFLSIPLNRQERTFWINFIPKEGKDKNISVDVPMSGQVGHVVDLFTKELRRPLLFHYLLAMVPDGEIDFKTPLSEIPTNELIFMEQEEHTNNSQPELLNFPTKESTLEDCLEEFFSPEVLEDEQSCQREKCKKKTTATKQLKLCTLPPILIIHFQRFVHENNSHQKVETFVDYPMWGLDLRRFLQSSSSNEEAIYDLIAVTNHTGLISDSYYTAYAQHTENNRSEWYNFDDSRVTLVKSKDCADDIVTKDAYLLFYMKRGI
jgi:ubiquitin C-terminal hydrolase